MMWTTKKCKEIYGGNLCRHCINDVMHVHLYPKDCHYETERKTCSRCHQGNKHIVCGFKLSGLWKLMGKHI